MRKIERGIIIASGNEGIAVRSPGHVYYLNNEKFYSKSLCENDKVLGVIINSKFSVCREFISVTGHFVFGYVTTQPTSNQIWVQTINEFDLNTFNPFEANYAFGEKVIVEIN